MQSEPNSPQNRIQIEMQPKQQQKQQVVLFKFKRAYHEESYDQIKIQSKKVKANPENVEKAEDLYRRKHFMDRETMLENLFQKLDINNQGNNKSAVNEKYTAKGKQEGSKQISTSQSSVKGSYFLKKIQVHDLDNDNTHEPTQSSQQQTNQIREHMSNIRQHARKTDLQQKLNKLRGIVTEIDKSSSSGKKRVVYKIIDIKQQNIVDFNGQKFEYQDLSREYTQGERSSIAYDYYVLRKGQASLSSNLPQIILPQEAQYLLDTEQNPPQDRPPSSSSSDSNRQDRSDYDYPQQDYHQGDDDDDKSEGIISGGKAGSDDYGQDQDLKNSYQQEDEQEHYRQYLKRCRKVDQGDDQLTYLYNLEKNRRKYRESDDDSDDD